MSTFERFWKDQGGATAIEYCFIAGLISVAIVGGLTPIGVKLKSYFTTIAAH